jgi:hypothetical protein
MRTVGLGVGQRRSRGSDKTGHKRRVPSLSVDWRTQKTEERERERERERDAGTDLHKCVGFFFLLPTTTTTTTTMARLLQIWSASMLLLVLMILPAVQGIHETGFQLLQDLFSSSFLVKFRGVSKAVICFGQRFFLFFLFFLVEFFLPHAFCW